VRWLYGDRRLAMGESYRGFVLQCYKWPVIVDVLTNKYEKVIKRTQLQNIRELVWTPPMSSLLFVMFGRIRLQPSIRP